MECRKSKLKWSRKEAWPGGRAGSTKALREHAGLMGRTEQLVHRETGEQGLR